MQNQPPYQGAPQAPVSAKPHKKMTPASWLFVAIVTMISLLIICGVAWVLLLTKVSSDNGKTQVAAYNILEPKAAQPVESTIQSNLGITVPFNSAELAGFGYDGTITYSLNDLAQTRPYTVIRVRPIETSEATRNTITIDSPELRITTSTDKNFWSTLQSDKTYKDLSKADALVKKAIAERTTDKNTKASSAQVVTLGKASTEYKKVTFTHDDENYAIPTISREDCYSTVQNDRPYVACINNIRPSNFASTPQLESVLEQVSFTSLDKAALTDDKMDEKGKKELYSGKDDEKIDAPSTPATQNQPGQKVDASVKVPAYLANSHDFSVITKTEPAAIRIGTIYCANVTLAIPDSSAGVNLSGACVDRSSSGFIMSKDGLVATLASKVKVTPRQAVQAYISNAADDDQASERLGRLLDYMVKSRIIMETDADALTSGLQERNRDVIAKINSLATQIPAEDISVDKDFYKYAVQLGDKGIVVNRNGDGMLDFAYSDTVFEASLEGSVFDDSKSSADIFNGQTPDKDMALLRLKKQNPAGFPTLQLAASSNLGNGAIVNIIGQPMYAFGGLEGGQFRSTPLIRQGVFSQSFTISAGQRLQSLSTPSHAGLSGAPVVNATGEVVGLATYDDANCPDAKCFSDMLIRDPAPLLGIVKKRNITLQPISPVSDVWNNAVDAYVAGNYTRASELFTKSASLYPANYLAPQFAALAKSQVGSATDTSSANSMVDVIKVAMLIILIILVLLIIARLFMKVFSKPHYETQYGQMAGGQYIDARQWRQGGGYQQPPQPAPIAQPIAPAYSQPSQPIVQAPPVQQPPQPVPMGYPQMNAAPNPYQAPGQAVPTQQQGMMPQSPQSNEPQPPTQPPQV